MEVGEYVAARKLAREAAFAWWVPYRPRKWDRIISEVKSRVRKANKKYGIFEFSQTGIQIQDLYSTKDTFTSESSQGQIS